MHESRGKLRRLDWRGAVGDDFVTLPAGMAAVVLVQDQRQSKAFLRFDPDGPFSPLPTPLNASTPTPTYCGLPMIEFGCQVQHVLHGINTWKDENWVFHKLAAKDAIKT